MIIWQYLLGIISAGEVTVVRVDNGVLLALLDILTVPLANAGSTSVSQNQAANVVQRLSQAVACNGGTDLFRAGCDGKLGLGLDAVLQGLTSNAG